MTAEPTRWRIVSMAEVPLSAYVEVLAHGRPWLDPDRIDAWLHHRCFAVNSFMAMAGGQPVGAVLAIAETGPRPAALYLDQLVVAPDHRRQGLARALVGHCEERAHSLHASSMWLCSDPCNPAAHGWARLGFTVRASDHLSDGWPVHRDFKGPGRDRIVFVKSLDPSFGENRGS